MKKRLVRVTKMRLPTYWYEVGEVHQVIGCSDRSNDWRVYPENNGREIKGTDAELLPGWDTYPDWAQWRAVDEDGDLFIFDQKPRQSESSWWPVRPEESREKLVAEGSDCPNWKDTLEERPWKASSISFGEAVKKCEEGISNALRPPYEHSFYAPGFGNYGSSSIYDHYSRLMAKSLFGILFGSFITKEENEMDCPRSKILMPAERVEAKLDRVRDNLAAHVTEEQERITKLDELYIAIKDHSEKAFEDEIVATLLRKADQI